MRRVIRHLLLLFALALGQAVLTVALTVFVFGSGMSRFGTGDPAPAGVEIASVLVGALAYPVLPLITQLPLTMRPWASLGNTWCSWQTAWSGRRVFSR
jgi:hypothetical protein